MRVFIETPKYSFVKYRIVGGALKREFLSPLPNLFNYGFIEGTVSADGMEKDAIVLGRRLKQGIEVDVAQVGVVHIIDGGVMDDKVVTSSDGKMSFWDRVKIEVFFRAYMEYKKARCIVLGGNRKCSYGGFTPSPRR
jgi:inorganic pyrophosphatase